MENPNANAIAKRRRPRVLIVEDDGPTREGLTCLLRRMGVDVSGAASVAQGLEMLDGQDRLILDLSLPDGYGATVLERVRLSGKPTLVAIFSGQDRHEFLDRVAPYRPDAFFQKPDFSALLEWAARG